MRYILDVRANPPDIAGRVLYARDTISIGLIGGLFERDSSCCESALLSGIDVLTINVQG
jgi:hypothetical protein